MPNGDQIKKKHIRRDFILATLAMAVLFWMTAAYNGYLIGRTYYRGKHWVKTPVEVKQALISSRKGRRNYYYWNVMLNYDYTYRGVRYHGSTVHENVFGRYSKYPEPPYNTSRSELPCSYRDIGLFQTFYYCEVDVRLAESFPAPIMAVVNPNDPRQSEVISLRAPYDGVTPTDFILFLGSIAMAVSCSVATVNVARTMPKD